MQKGIVVKFIVLVVCALLLGGYILRDKQQVPLTNTAATNLQQYSSEDGVSFMYPDTYQLSSSNHTVGNFNWDSIDFVNKNYTPPVNGEGSTAISLSVFSNPKNLPIEEWIKTDPRSNYKLSREGTLTKGTIGGQQSLAYQFSGLYENDAVVVTYNGKIFLFSDSWMQTIDPIRHDFNTVLSSVQFH